MNLYYLQEEKTCFKIPVRFSSSIKQQIDNISTYNKNNIDSLSQWYDYLKSIKHYLSIPQIAWDYTNTQIKFPNGTRFVKSFDYNVGYTIKTNSNLDYTYVYIFKVNLNPENFGLKVPPTLKENKKKAVRLTESHIRHIIRETLIRLLQL